jgi:monovalent cation/hydrogen antiporter
VIALYRHRTGRPRAEATDTARKESDDAERHFRLVGLRAERSAIMELGRQQSLSDLTLQRMVRDLDLQETRHGG